MAGPNFDLVNQFAALRTGQGSGLTPIDVYRPTPVAIPQVTPQQSMGATAVTGKVGHHAGDGHDHSGGKLGPGGLVEWRGQKTHSSIVPHLDALSKQFPTLRFSNSYRDPERNKRANGVKNSWHLQGKAADFVGAPKDMYAAQAWAKANGAKEALVHNAGSGLHLHVAWH